MMGYYNAFKYFYCFEMLYSVLLVGDFLYIDMIISI